MKLTNIKGIGQKKLEQFERGNIVDCLDLIFYLPEKFFFSKPGYFEFNRKSYYCGKIRILKTTMLRFKRGLKAVCEIFENGEPCEILFFRQGYLKNTLNKNTAINIIGEVKRNEKGCLNFFSPKWNMHEDLSSLTGMLPQYKPIGNIKSRELEKFINIALSIVEEESIRLKYIEHDNMKSLFRKIHFPQDEDELKTAKEIFLLDKMVEYFMKVKCLKKKNQQCLYLNNINSLLDELVKDLPFNLTVSQRSTLDSILLSSGTAFDILLHGEVGSGKTIIAFITAIIYYRNGYQTAFLSPTESLCYQTYLKFREFYPEIRCHLVTRSTDKTKFSSAKTDVDSNIPVVIFGTHKILSKGFVFSKLGLVVIDEQQKFGVNQRRKLISKGITGNADVLLMSATPIPRTLALILSAGYTIEKIEKHDVESMKETFIISPAKLDQLFKKVAIEVEKGHQGFFVCPRITGDGGYTIEKVIELVNKHPDLKDYKCAVLTGKMSGEQKQLMYDGFLSGDIDILLATGVIEVGIDIKNANIMIVFDANRFGLAQLHQLRGRIGRGNNCNNFFFMIPAEKNIRENTKTLNILKEYDNGYKIAQHDMNKRGIGELFGIRQHGNFDVILDDLIERPDLVKKAMIIAEKIEIPKQEEFIEMEDIVL